MSDVPPGQPHQPEPPGEEALLALDAYIDAVGATAGPAVPALGEPELAALVDRLRALSEPAWESAAPLFQPPLPPSAPEPVPVPAPAADRRSGRPRRRLSRRVLRPSAAEAAVAVVSAAVVLAAVVLINAFSGQPPPRPVTGVTAVPAAWRLAGFIDQPAWQAGGSAAAVGAAAVVTCPSGSTCYADKPGNGQGGTVVEATTDGGSTWRASPLPAGWRVTSGLACPTAARCLVGADGTVAAGSGAPAGVSPSVLATADGGATWSVQPLPPEVAQVTNLACTSPADCVGAGYGPATAADPQGPSVAVVTDDGGSSWTAVALPTPFVSDSPEGLACPTAQSCVLVGATGLVTPAAGPSAASGAALYSTDGGRSWSPAAVPAGSVRIRSVSCADAVHCVAVANGSPHPAPGTTTPDPYGPSEALATTDGGRTWSLAGSTGLVPASLTSISCPTAADCWAAGRLTAATLGTVVATDDAGATWATVPLPTALTPAQQRTTGLSQLDVQNVSSVSCPVVDVCVALGSQGSPTSLVEQQVVLRTEGG